MTKTGKSKAMMWRDGFRIVDLGELARQMYCKHCRALLDLNQTAKETRVGLASILTVVCHCGYNNDVHTAKQKAGQDLSFSHTINVSATISIMRCTLTSDMVHRVLTSLGIPLPPARKLGDYLMSTSGAPEDVNGEKTSSDTEDSIEHNPRQEEQLGKEDMKEIVAHQDPEKYNGHSGQASSSSQKHTKKFASTNQSPGTPSSAESKAILVSDLRLTKNQKNPEFVSFCRKPSLSNCSGRCVNEQPGVSPPKKSSTPPSTCKMKTSPSAARLPTGRPKGKRKIKDAPNKPHKCEHCGAAFKAPSSLRVHIRIHTGERPYVCSDCGATFVQAGGLLSHRRRHTGERPYMCDMCGFTCLQPDGLRKHVRIHTGERPFKCEACGAAFKQSSNLIVHKRIHTGERPFVCEQCGKSFACASTLIGHRYSHISDKQFTCDWCSKRFKKTKDLKIHKKKTCKARKKPADTVGDNSSVIFTQAKGDKDQESVWEGGCLPRLQPQL